MNARTKQQASRRARRALFGTSLLLAGLGAAAGDLAGQEALGVPYIGRNHLSFYLTELSRDGVVQERSALYGAVYGHRFGDRTAGVESSLVVKVAARALEDGNDGILESGATLALTRALPGLERASATAAAGLGMVGWGRGSVGDEADGGRLSLRAPLSVGAAYELSAGRITIAPFATLTAAWSSERTYVEDVRTATDSGWRTGHALGVTARFREAVLSLGGVHGERGMPHRNRFVFSAGMSW